MKTLKAVIAIIVLLAPLSIFADTISTVAPIGSSLLPTDRLPMGRPAGTGPQAGSEVTATVGQINAYVQSSMFCTYSTVDGGLVVTGKPSDVTVSPCKVMIGNTCPDSYPAGVLECLEIDR